MTITTRRLASAALLACCLVSPAGPAAAVELPLPAGAQLTMEQSDPAATYRLPTARWEDGTLPVERLDGRVTRRAWRVGGRALTTLQVLAPIRDALEEAGWQVLLDCETEGCGGFDFRFSTEVLPAPEMYVDLTDYRFLSARAPDGDAAIGLFVSGDTSATWLQAIRVVVDDAETDTESAPAPVLSASGPPTATAPAPTRTSGDVIARLEARGHAVLGDVDFASGASGLGDGAVASLDAIAGYLEANPDRRVLFVGHTDATGSLAANEALSRRRAEAAAGYLRDRHGLPAARAAAEGAGYLAPVDSNLTEAGRRRNRRVEAVLLPSE
ncbi:Peptidoglycan-binding protein ArfA [Roseivivax jejudonensis]|uniref:Peptidoglycan-binding protein ArfA n=1 Tax=Roseivivax jejudonensis TaxID=1529041 RepID=A0A1X6YEQ3_9RHOB|nr:OmpA family protein [Roseivivax jejudonensis]SLN19090.1 Peptidoglycan-binding protein ArfA [Roseivivax jejudonensis]